jgi:nitroreductase/Pyruvate/2-oxoacid:ferredoxin oxidoreductase delta subunit
MPVLEINKETCTKCGACIAACAGCIIIPQQDGFPRLLPGADDFCMLCGHCVGICPTDSVIHKEMPLEQCPPIEKKLVVSFQQVSQLIKSRRSIREFLEKPVPRELIEQIIDVARYAPTGHNMQDVRWLVIDDPEELKKLTAIGVEWFRSMADGDTPWAQQMQAILRMHELGLNIFLRNVPAVVVGYAEKNNPIANADCVIALSYFDIAAKAAGLGCYWNGYFYISAQSFPPMVEAVALPEGFTPYAALGIGYPRYRYQRIPVRKEARIAWQT